MFHGVIQKITLAQFFETRCRCRNTTYKEINRRTRLNMFSRICSFLVKTCFATMRSLNLTHRIAHKSGP